MDYIFETLELEHQEEVISIFNYYVEETTAAYRDKTVNNEFFSNFTDSSNTHCAFAIKNNKNIIVGFCLLEPYMDLPTFSEVAETTYFIHHEYTGRGIGTLALKKLEEEAIKRGIKKLLANTSSDNTNSIKFHEKNGFVEYGRLQSIAKKFDKYFSVVWLGKEIR